MNTALFDQFGTKKVSNEVKQELGAALKQKDLATANIQINGKPISNEVRSALIDMRDHIDSLSQELIKDGVVKDGLDKVVEDNIGNYLNTSYRVHNDKDWVEKVQGTQEWENAINWYAGQKKKEVGAAVPFGRMGTAQDLTGMAVFLASDAADYIVAQTYNVDGGQWMS